MLLLRKKPVNFFKKKHKNTAGKYHNHFKKRPFFSHIRDVV